MMNQAQIEANITLEQAVRRATLLAAAAEVSQNITHILDIDQLLPKTVDIICDAYNFYYSGVFLMDAAGEFAVLRAGRGEPGRIMIENNHKLAVGGNSMIGACCQRNEARISLDVDTEKVWYPNPVLPDTRSEMALPLAIGDRVIGAVTVQSVEPAAFSDEDVSSLQAMANQLAIAIDNARQRRELEATHAQLLRAKTYEAIATATGDAIHWIGNKAEPIGGSVARIRHDVQLLVCAIAEILQQPHEAHTRPLIQLLFKEAAAIQQNNFNMINAVEKINSLPLEKLEKHLSLNSTLEDLEIIEDAARLIMKVKEDLIGPAREQAPRPVMADDVVKDAVNGLNLPPGIVTIKSDDNLPLVLADPIQLNRVIVNLVNNAYEAMGRQPQPQINIQLSGKANVAQISVSDNGSGIDPENLDKIFITFHTTKGVKGHPGLGLPACRLIVEQIGGNISVSTRPGIGSSFTVNLPLVNQRELAAKPEPGKGKILLVDDEDNWQKFAKRALEMAGYNLTIAGRDYHMNTLAPYDLIIVDDILARTDSMTVYKAIKEAGAITKTVAVSSNPRVERTKERMLLGVRNLLPKPYTLLDLSTQVKSVLSALR
jgi:signal transduction histidine kinase/CheY-like chemotaxis protein